MVSKMLKTYFVDISVAMNAGNYDFFPSTLCLTDIEKTRLKLGSSKFAG